MVIHSYGKQRIIFNDIQTLVSTTTTEKQARLFDEGFKKKFEEQFAKKRNIYTPKFYKGNRLN